MIPDPYNSLVRTLFAEPGHAGTVADGTGVLADDQGVRLELSAGVDQGRIAAMRFRAWGCPHLLAAAEWSCRHFEGRAVSDLENCPTARIMEYLAVPAEKTGRILVLEDAIHSLGHSLRQHTQGS